MFVPTPGIDRRLHALPSDRVSRDLLEMINSLLPTVGTDKR